MRSLAISGCAVLVAGLVGCGPRNPQTSQDPPIPASPAPGEERCDPHEPLFRLVAGPSYVGVVIPASYFVETRGREIHFAGRYGWRASDAWTPTETDIDRAEGSLLAALTDGAAEPARIDPSAVGNPGRARLDREILKSILADLLCYRRQYAGFIVDGRRQVLCRFFLPDRFLFRTWQCRYVSGVDFKAELWQVWYDPETGTYGGFDFGS